MPIAPAPEATIPWPDNGYSSVPFMVYQDDEVYAREQEKIFRGRVWNFLCLEIELPNPGDYRTTEVGDTPIIVTRDMDGNLHALVNRCVHKGALVRYDQSGNADILTCVYHNWTYHLDGKLASVAFARGVNNKGGLPDDFDMSCHGLRRLRVETFCGLIFGTFSDETEPLEQFLGPEMSANMRRVLGRPVELIGYHSQYLKNNWKLYVENVKDSYHASLLHLFFNTFKLNRLSMVGGIEMDSHGRHHISYSKMATDQESDEYNDDDLRATQDDFGLADPSLIERWDEFGDGTTLAIQTLFPTMTLQQIHNSIAVRLLVPKGTDECELHWWVLGYADDTEEQRAIRLRQSNLIGPAGFISMEDGIIGGFVQRGIAGREGENSLIEMGGRDVAPDEDSRVTETSVRGFWKGYRELMES